MIRKQTARKTVLIERYTSTARQTVASSRGASTAISFSKTDTSSGPTPTASPAENEYPRTFHRNSRTNIRGIGRQAE
jgi:hypothetical protein